MVLFKMCDSVPSARYSPVCNVLRLWRIWLISIIILIESTYSMIIIIINAVRNYIPLSLRCWGGEFKNGIYCGRHPCQNWP